MKDNAFVKLSKIYRPTGCLNCMDYSAELADFSVGDPYLRNQDVNYAFGDGWSLALVRTKGAERILSKLQRKGDLVLQQVPPALLHGHLIPTARAKKNHAFYRIRNLKRRGKPFPNYHLEMPNLSLREKLEAQLFFLSLSIRKPDIARQLYFNFAFSPLGNSLSRLKASVKRKREQLRVKKSALVQ